MMHFRTLGAGTISIFPCQLTHWMVVIGCFLSISFYDECVLVIMQVKGREGCHPGPAVTVIFVIPPEQPFHFSDPPGPLFLTWTEPWKLRSRLFPAVSPLGNSLAQLYRDGRSQTTLRGSAVSSNLLCDSGPSRAEWENRLLLGNRLDQHYSSFIKSRDNVVANTFSTPGLVKTICPIRFTEKPVWWQDLFSGSTFGCNSQITIVF